MTDLTEQLYAGTLPTGYYYFNNGVETYIVLYKNINSKHLILQEPEGLKVLCKVPSYEEWQAKLEENAQFKELLKKHRDIFARTLALCIDLNFSEKQKNQFADDIAEIDQALGEK